MQAAPDCFICCSGKDVSTVLCETSLQYVSSCATFSWYTASACQSFGLLKPALLCDRTHPPSGRTGAWLKEAGERRGQLPCFLSPFHVLLIAKCRDYLHKLQSFLTCSILRAVTMWLSLYSRWVRASGKKKKEKKDNQGRAIGLFGAFKVESCFKFSKWEFRHQCQQEKDSVSYKWRLYTWINNPQHWCDCKHEQHQAMPTAPELPWARCCALQHLLRRAHSRAPFLLPIWSPDWKVQCAAPFVGSGHPEGRKHLLGCFVQWPAPLVCLPAPLGAGEGHAGVRERELDMGWSWSSSQDYK